MGKMSWKWMFLCGVRLLGWGASVPMTWAAACVNPQKLVTAEFIGTTCTDPSSEFRQGMSFLPDGGTLDTTGSRDTIAVLMSPDGSFIHNEIGFLTTATFKGRISKFETNKQFNVPSIISDLVMNGIEQLPEGGTLDTTHVSTGPNDPTDYVRRTTSSDGTEYDAKSGVLNTTSFSGHIYETENKTNRTQVIDSGVPTSYLIAITRRGIEQLPDGGTLDTTRPSSGPNDSEDFDTKAVLADGTEFTDKHGVLQTLTFKGRLYARSKKRIQGGIVQTSSNTVLKGIEKLPEGGTLDTLHVSTGPTDPYPSDGVFHTVRSDGTEYYERRGFLHTPGFEGHLTQYDVKYLNSSNIWVSSSLTSYDGTWRISPSEILVGTFMRRVGTDGSIYVADNRHSAAAPTAAIAK